MTTLYKFLDQGGRGTHSRYQWPLPMRGGDGAWQPGAWVEVAGDLVVCQNAIHACRAEDCLNWLGPRLYTIAFRDDNYLLHADDPAESKVFGRAARLLAPVETWNDRTTRLFACDCAERVLSIFEREKPDDSRPREAIAVARRFANGQATSEEFAAARDAAWAAARDAAWAAERAWQTQRFLAYVNGEVQ